jgi:hypothetical protein
MKLFTRKPPFIPKSLQILRWERVDNHTYVAERGSEVYIVARGGRAGRNTVTIDTRFHSDDFEVRGILKYVRANSSDKRSMI